MSSNAVSVSRASTSSFVTFSNGRKYHYLERYASGPSVLFLHGYIDSSYSFEALLNAFEHPVHSFSLDWRGHGATEEADSYTLADHAVDATEFIERVIGEPVILVGHSLGSIVAQRVATARPDLVKKLVLIAAAPTAANHPGLLELRDDLARFDKAVPDIFIEDFQRSTVYAPISETTILRYIDESRRVGLGAWRGALDGLIGEPPGAPQPVTVRALVLWGAHDGLFDAESQKALKSLLAQSQTVRYDDAGHAPHWEFPERVARDIERFLEEK